MFSFFLGLRISWLDFLTCQMMFGKSMVENFGIIFNFLWYYFCLCWFLAFIFCYCYFIVVEFHYWRTPYYECGEINSFLVSCFSFLWHISVFFIFNSCFVNSERLVIPNKDVSSHYLYPIPFHKPNIWIIVITVSDN